MVTILAEPNDDGHSPHRPRAIEFRNVSYGLNGGSEVLRGLNLEIRRGETLVLWAAAAREKPLR